MDDPSSLLFLFDVLSRQGESILIEPTLDPVSITIQVVIIILGLLFSALFSGSEVAFFSVINQQDLLADRDVEGTKDRQIAKMLEKPRRLLATILICNTFANIIASVLAAVVTGNIVAYFGLPELWIYTVEVVVLTFMILILSEITPKVMAINNPVKSARRVSGFIYGLFLLLKPLSSLIANSTLSLEERLPKPNSKMTSEDIMTMAEVSEQEGSIKSDEREIIENVIEFGSTTVREIMTSRVNIVAISIESSLNEVLQLIREKGLSRMPIYENDLDNIVGVIHSKDVLPYINADVERTTINWRTIARKALFIPSTKKVDDLLRDFQQEKTHIAIVVDEYGGTEGLITLDDILEEIVGEISDEYDETEENLYTKFKSGVYIFDAKVDLDDMEEILDIDITTGDDEYETLGGLVYHLTERIPNVGERVYYKNMELTIHSIKNNRVKKLRVKVQDRPKSSQEHTPK
ncbi:gliding motility-associated protein GldE [Fodinibius sp. Rm-B-1B1-1]|uniref:hemolysin family protein n=1 Tax=Fodinibius alkaliphilus TaxID=3140241 RepID=UPI00315A5988